MMICWMQVDVLPQLSVAIYVLEMVSGQLRLSLMSLTQVTVGIPQLSVAVTNEVSGAGKSVIHSMVIAGGQTITGAVVSRMMITWEQVEVFPQLSVAM